MCVCVCMHTQEYEIPTVPYSQKPSSLADNRAQWAILGGQWDTDSLQRKKPGHSKEWERTIARFRSSHLAWQWAAKAPELLGTQGHFSLPALPLPRIPCLDCLWKGDQNQQYVNPQRQALQVRLENSVTRSWKARMLQVLPCASNCLRARHAPRQSTLQQPCAVRGAGDSAREGKRLAQGHLADE